MSITNQDIVLFQAQDNTDNDNGGGSRTNNLIADGDINNLFPDISRIDTTSGDVALRKVFPVINTDNRDIYYGAHVIFRTVPEDPNVSALIFFTDDPHDIRSEAQNKIEAYVVPSYKAPFYLFGNHIEGSKAVTWLQTLEESLPDVGETYLLKNGSQEQYIRINDIDDTVITLTYNSNPYQRRRIIATITQPLEFAFTGSNFNPDGQQSNTTDTFTTQVADTSRFYSTKTLSEDAVTGANVIKLDSIYEQLVPSTIQQTPLVNKDALNQGDLLITDSDSQAVSITESVLPNQTNTMDFSILPGSWQLGTSLYDDGNGNVLDSGNVVVGTINYTSGEIYYTKAVQGNSTYKPASIIQTAVKNSLFIQISQENQNQVYVQNLNPLPAAPNLYIDYRSSGKWYRLVCNQDGTIGNDAQIGAGNLNDNGDGTGTVSLTLGAIPDLDSQIIYSWSDQESLNDLADYTPSIRIAYPLSTMITSVKNLIAENFTMSWGNASVTSDAAGNLSFTGPDADGLNGSLDIENGIVFINSITSADLPSPSETISFNVDYYGDIPPGTDGETVTTNDPAYSTGTDVNGKTEITLNVGAVLGPNMVIKIIGRRQYEYDADPFVNPVTQTYYLTSNGVFGELKSKYNIDGGLVYTGYNAGELLLEGSFDSSGNISFIINKAIAKINNVNWRTDPASNWSDGTIWANPNGDVYTETEYDAFIIDDIEFVTFQPAEILPGQSVLNATPTGTFGDNAKYELSLPADISGQVQFKIEDELFFSRDGNIYHHDSNIQVGTINNSTGEVTLSYFNESPTLNNINVDLTNVYTDVMANQQSVRMVAFRTASDDLVTSSFQFRYKVIGNATLYSATTDANGVITGTYIDSNLSYVDTITGAAIIVFTNPADPLSFKYDAVAQTTLPLDPELLGLNPVRLPPNGKVPVFRPGYHVIIFHEQETPIVGTPTAGQTVTLNRDKQSYVEVVDVNGARLAFDQYTADRDAGTVTFADPLSLVDRNGDAMTGPYVINDRVEDMVLCTSADINGVIGLSSSLVRDYPANETKVASALVWGDIGSRYFNLFSQQTFDDWYDEQTTDPITAQYDDVNYPIQINNKDSVSGRWMVRFTGSTTVEVIEENLGTLLTGVDITTTAVEPINPANGLPYWSMAYQGFGSGWVTGNIIRFNTESGDQNMWLIRTVQSGQLTLDIDSIETEIRGDAN